MIGNHLKQFSTDAMKEFTDKPDSINVVRPVENFLYDDEISLDQLCQRCIETSRQENKDQLFFIDSLI